MGGYHRTGGSTFVRATPMLHAYRTNVTRPPCIVNHSALYSEAVAPASQDFLRA